MPGISIPRNASGRVHSRICTWLRVGARRFSEHARISREDAAIIGRTRLGHPAFLTYSFVGREVLESANRPKKADIILHDGDTKFTQQFKDVLKAEKIRPNQVPYESPNCNAYVERFIQTIQQECLDHFVVLGERHLDHLVREFVEHYHTERPHQGVGNVVLSGSRAVSTGGIVSSERLGGLLKHYTRVA